MTASVWTRERARANGTTAYRAEYRTDGHLRTQTFDDRRERDNFVRHAQIAGIPEALRVLEEREKAGDLGLVTTVEEAWDHDLAHLTRPKQGTSDKYDRRVRATGSWLDRFGAYPIAAISHEMIVKWIRERSATRAAKTVKNEGTLLGSLLRDAQRRGLITVDPYAGVHYPKAYNRTELIVLTTDELNHLMAELPQRWRPFVWTLAATGLRINEATALRWQDVDLDAGLLRVQHGWHQTAAGWVLETPKTPRSRRTIDLEDRDVAVLQGMLAADRETGRDVTPQSFVFTQPRGGHVRDNSFREDVWHPARLRAGVRDVTPHDLRHLHASYLLANGMDIADVSERLGHESVELTHRVYSHLVPARRARARLAIRAAMIAVNAPI